MMKEITVHDNDIIIVPFCNFWNLERTTLAENRRSWSKQWRSIGLQLVPHSFHKQISIAEESMHYIWMHLREEFQDKASLASDTCYIEIGEKTKNMTERWKIVRESTTMCIYKKYVFHIVMYCSTPEIYKQVAISIDDEDNCTHYISNGTRVCQSNRSLFSKTFFVLTIISVLLLRFLSMWSRKSVLFSTLAK